MAILVLIHTKSFIDRASKKIVIFFYSTNFEEYSNIYDFFFFTICTRDSCTTMSLTYIRETRSIHRAWGPVDWM